MTDRVDCSHYAKLFVIKYHNRAGMPKPTIPAVATVEVPEHVLEIAVERMRRADEDLTLEDVLIDHVDLQFVWSLPEDFEPDDRLRCPA